jgi:hypothetical protein
MGDSPAAFASRSGKALAYRSRSTVNILFAVDSASAFFILNNWNFGRLLQIEAMALEPEPEEGAAEAIC